ncbi:MAG TPA: hypothetical protein ENK52_03050 [Saprospiraceae bacterium]|nr:hypothetical protein [Saprospiraceae bacterium]
MKKIELRDSGFEKHICKSKLQGNWIVWKCPQCDYVRRFNYKTKKMLVKGGRMEVMHSGQHAPTGIDLDNLKNIAN